MKLELEIANRIRELRIAKNMTQEKLAEKIGFDVSFLGRIERGKSANIQINTLEKIIHALDEDYTTFFLLGIQKTDTQQFYVKYRYLKIGMNYWISLKEL